MSEELWWRAVYGDPVTPPRKNDYADQIAIQKDDQRVGAWLREHDPDRYAEIMEVSK